MEPMLRAGAGDEALARACLANAGAIGEAIAGHRGAVAERGPAIDRHRSEADGGLWNAVTRTALSDGAADAAIRATIAWYGPRTLRWWTGPSDRPADLDARLLAHGFDGARVPGMACDLTDGGWDAPVPGALEIGRAGSPDDVRDFLAVLTAVYRDAGWQESWHVAFASIGFADDAPVRIFVGREGGRPVSSSFLVLGAGVAGIYGVHTDPAERGRGLGTALTRAPMRHARDAGYEIAVLQAAPRAAALYRRIAFKTVCEVGIYEREPNAGAVAR